MNTLKVNETVLEQLQQAFPKPASAANRALDKYVDKLQTLIDEAVWRGRSAFDTKFYLYSIRLTDLSRNSPKLGTGKQQVRLHKWLEFNNLALIKVVKKGSNIGDQYSQIALTNLVELTSSVPAADDQTVDKLALDVYLSGNEVDDTALFERLYPDLVDQADQQYVVKHFDCVPIDMASLKNYIKFLLEGITLIKESNKQQYLLQAKLILSIATVTGGVYPQRKKRSEFGRMYYSGVSVQNVNKELRRAMLGDCWEYDISSSVITWKMTFAAEYVNENAPEATVDKHFRTTLWYLHDKRDFMREVVSKVFLADTRVHVDQQTALMKQAITALSFGARLTRHGWKTAGGDWQKTALESILHNRDELKRFVKCTEVRAFVSEQNCLDKYLHDAFKEVRPDLIAKPMLRTAKHSSRSKVVAYFYQQCETQVMKIIYSYLEKCNKQVIAKIHDAFIVRNKLSAQLKAELEYEMQQATSNEYWKLSAKHLEAYRPVYTEQLKFEAEHRKFIELETQRALEYAKAQGD